MSSAALILFGKVPLPGRVKTRLARTVGAEAAADLSEAFLRDAVRLCSALVASRPAGEIVPILSGDPAPHPFWDSIPTPPWRIEPQGEGDLGRRLSSAFERGFRTFERVAVLGADHPGLPLRELERFVGCRNAIWPARDGGYAALILSRHPRAADLFEGVDWSTDRVFEQTAERARRASIELEVFPEAADVDHEEDLRRLAEDLAGREDLPALATRAALARLGR